MKKYVHTLDIAFNVQSDHEDWQDVPAQEIIDALRRRVEYITSPAQLGELADAVGHVDTYENDRPRPVVDQ